MGTAVFDGGAQDPSIHHRGLFSRLHLVQHTLPPSKGSAARLGTRSALPRRDRWSSPRRRFRHGA